MGTTTKFVQREMMQKLIFFWGFLFWHDIDGPRGRSDQSYL